MASRTLSACNNCRKLMLRSFIASIGAPAYNLPRRAFATSSASSNLERHGDNTAQHHSESQGQPAQHDKTHLSQNYQSPFKLQEQQNKQRLVEAHQEQDTSDGDTTPGATSISQEVQQSSHVPWYLQNQAPVTAQNQSAISARQQLPDLPEYPPSILQPLLEHISVSLGMDDLSLIDLRTMDPPPALGANLIMIVGSSRSEKHLHVSADRLCRWLRTEYKLTPYADGLLGRNELKLKMRRLAKKKKLLSAVGSSMADDEEADDGIRTGWVCVNIGRVEGGELPKTAQQIENEKKIVGFGTTTSGSRIVVQLLTEEKREEIGLERLWRAVLKKNEMDRKRLFAGEAAAGEETEVADEAASVAEAAVAETESETPVQRVPATPSQGSASAAQDVSTYVPFDIKGKGNRSDEGRIRI